MLKACSLEREIGWRLESNTEHATNASSKQEQVNKIPLRAGGAPAQS